MGVARRSVTAVAEPTVIAVDWSGARRPQGIWLAAVRDGVVVESRPVATREEAIDDVAGRASPIIAGFDFSFSVPAWFATELGCATVEQIWARAAADGERWLHPTLPFWRARCAVPPDRRFRRCEGRYPTAKSVFQLVGDGQVGAGSVRGMPLLESLRDAGFAIWPFDAAGPAPCSRSVERTPPAPAGYRRPSTSTVRLEPRARGVLGPRAVGHRHEVARLGTATR